MKREKFIINGGKELNGVITNQTSKNAILPIMSACLLTKGKTVLNSYPRIIDVDNMIAILKKLGASVRRIDKSLTINTNLVNSAFVDYKLSKTMRSSIFLLGSLLARFKSACITMPGGCAIGKRPIDIHLSAFKKLGVKINFVEDNIFFDATKAKPTTIKLKLPSVGATENIIQFCSLLKGKTTIINAAREPEVADLCNFLNKMGARILGAGTSKITIYGVDKLIPTSYKPIGDRITSGTIMLAVAICGGDVTINNACPHENLKLIEKLCSMGCQIDVKNDIIHIRNTNNLISPKVIKTSYYPKFPTDLQSQMLVACCVVKGETIITETVFENRFQIIDQLRTMGAKIIQNNCNSVKILGNAQLHGANVVAKDLRGGAALVLAGLAAKGITTVSQIKFVDRGYEELEKTLSILGADIKREWKKVK